MHTLYVVYDENSQVTDFVIDTVPATRNFISLDRGPLSYVQSIVNNLNTYSKKNGGLTIDNDYLSKIRHGKFDQTYGAIENNGIENSHYPSGTASTAETNFESQPVAEPKTLTVTVPGTQMPSPKDKSIDDVKSHNELKDEPLPADAAKYEAPQDKALQDSKSQDKAPQAEVPQDDKSKDEVQEDDKSKDDKSKDTSTNSSK